MDQGHAKVKTEAFVQIKWAGATFALRQDNGDWRLNWQSGGIQHRWCGPDAAVMLGDAINAAGLDGATKERIFSKLMEELRERMFN